MLIGLHRASTVFGAAVGTSGASIAATSLASKSKHNFFILLPCLWTATNASLALATPLLGDVAAVYDSPEAAVDNPANAGFIAHSGLAGSAEGMKFEKVAARYPGLDPITIQNSGLSVPLAKPGIVYKASPRLGVGGFVVPPVPYTFEVTKKQLPVILLGQPFYLSATVKAQLLGAASFIMGYRLSNNFGIGIGGDYTAVKFNAVMSEFQSGTTLAVVDGSAVLANAIIGARIMLANGRIGLGMATSVMQMQQTKLDISSPLINGGSAQDSLKAATSGLNKQKSFTNMLVGLRLKPNSSLTFMGEVRYTRSDPEQESVSIINLKKEAVDVRDVMAIRAGVVLNAAPRVNLLSGFRFEPSPIGPGRLGDDPRVGFGTMEFLMAAAGLAPLGEYYMVAGGLQLGVLQAPHKQGSSDRYWRLIIEGGLAFTEASIGIDETGEMPGAYYYRKIAAVGGLKFNF